MRGLSMKLISRRSIRGETRNKEEYRCVDFWLAWLNKLREARYRFNILLLNITWVCKREMCTVVVFTCRATIRVVLQLYKAKNKNVVENQPGSINRPIEQVLRQVGFYYQTGGQVLLRNESNRFFVCLFVCLFGVRKHNYSKWLIRRSQYHAFFQISNSKNYWVNTKFTIKKAKLKINDK